MQRILNLTQHQATKEQLDSGVMEPTPEDKERIQELLTFDSLPLRGHMHKRAEHLAVLADQYGPSHAMIGGAPFFMAWLEKALDNYGIVPIYAFSVRESIEETQEDGSVVKRNVFRHKGFVMAK